MKDPGRRLRDLARALADSTPIDWRHEESAAHDEDERELIQVLRAIGERAEMHRTRAQTPARFANPEGFPRWGSLDIVGRVGEGASAEVFRAWDPQLSRDVALKLFRFDRPLTESDRKTLLEEGRNLARVRHENVVTVFGAAEHGGRIGLWMELVEGHTLSELISARDPFSAEEASRIGIELCRALAAVHRKGLVHGDVKAQNVKREAGGRIVLMDFSTSRSVEDPSTGLQSDPTGTPLYMAPELWKGAPPSPESDIYALGVLLFHLVTARFPVWGANVAELERAHEEHHRRLLRDERPGLPESFVGVVEKALSHDAKERFASVGAMERALSGVLPSGGIGEPTAAGKTRALLASIVGIPVALIALGFLTTTAYETFLKIPGEFTSETTFSYLVWGTRAMIPVAFYWIAFAILGVVLMGLALLTARIFRPGLDLARELRSRLARVDPVVSSTVVFLLGTAVWVGLWFWFSDLFDAMSRLDEPGVDRTILALGARPYHMAHTASYALLSLLLAMGVRELFPDWIRRGRRSMTVRVMKWGVSGLVALSVVLAVLPWRLLWHNEAERVEVDGHKGALLAETASRALVFVPDGLDRTQWVVNLDDPRLKRSGTREALFGP